MYTLFYNGSDMLTKEQGETYFTVIWILRLKEDFLHIQYPIILVIMIHKIDIEYIRGEDFVFVRYI